MSTRVPPAGTIGNLNPVIFKDFGILNSTLFFQLHDITMRKIIQYNSTFTQTQIKKFIQITPLGSETRLTREHNNQKENTNKCYYLCSKVNYVISKSDSVSDPKDNIKHSWTQRILPPPRRPRFQPRGVLLMWSKDCPGNCMLDARPCSCSTISATAACTSHPLEQWQVAAASRATSLASSERCYSGVESGSSIQDKS